MMLWLLTLACHTADPKAAVLDDTDVADDSDPPVVDDSDSPVDDTDTPHVPCAGPDGFEIGAATFSTLQRALDAAVDGDTITVCPGTWPGRAATYDVGAITLAGFTPDPAAQVLDGQSNDAILTLLGDHPEVTVRDLTFANGFAWHGAAGLSVRCTPGTGGSLTLDDVVFRALQASGGGAAVWTVGVDDVDLTDVAVLDNTAGNNGTVLLDAVRSSVHVLRTTFSGNRAGELPNVGGFTAGLHVYRHDNSQAPLDVTIEDSTFDDNTVVLASVGTALRVDVEAPALAHVTLRRNSFARNIVEAWAGAGRYGAVWLGTATGLATMSAELTDNLFDGNGGLQGAHLTVQNSNPDHTFHVNVTGGAFWRAAWEPAWLDIFPDWHASAISPTADDLFPAYLPTVITFTDVDFGTGPTANSTFPAYKCFDAVEGIVSGEISLADQDWCP